jgi:hypothetical protein
MFQESIIARGNMRKWKQIHEWSNGRWHPTDSLMLCAGMILAAYRESLDLSPENSSGLMSKTLSNSSEEFAWNRIITVSADPSFVFPGHEFYASLAAQGVSVNDSLGPEVGPLLCDAYRSVFKKISLPFSGHASIGMIEHQVRAENHRKSFGITNHMAT